jgi:hypothetical protein
MKMFNTILTTMITLSTLSCATSTDKVNATGPQFVIEREIPGAGNLTPEELKAASMKSLEILKELGPSIQWQHSYVTADKVYCVYTAPSKELIIEHAQRVGVPANLISEISSIVSPATAQ